LHERLHPVVVHVQRPVLVEVRGRAGARPRAPSALPCRREVAEVEACAAAIISMPRTPQALSRIWPFFRAVFMPIETKSSWSAAQDRLDARRRREDPLLDDQGVGRCTG